MTYMSKFAHTIFERTYAHDTADGGKEKWEDVAHRVTKNVMRAVGVDMRTSLAKEIRAAISLKKFMPAGRYLYSAGRPYHQCCNCYSGDTKAVTSKGAICLRDLVGTKPTLMTTGGEWKESEVHSFGVQKLYAVTLSFGKSKKVVYATANHSWRVASICGKLRLHGKKKVDTVDLSTGDTLCQVFGYGMGRTFVSPHGAAHGVVFGDGTDTRGSSSRVRLCGEKTELKKLFSLFPQSDIYSPDILVTNLPWHYKQRPSLELDRSYLLGWLAGYFAADGCVSKDGNCTLSCANKRTLEFVKDVAYIVGIGVNPIRETTGVSNLTGKERTLYSVSFRTSTLTRDFFLRDKHAKRFKETKRATYWKVVSVEETDREEEVFCAVVPETHEFVLEDNILVGNCLLMRAHDSREGWSEIMAKASKALMTGAGVGVVYSDIRHENAKIRKTGGLASGPIPLMQMVNECGRGVMQGGSRRSAVWAGLKWSHPDVHKFIRIKNWPPEVVELKSRDFSFPATLDHTNISVGLDDDFFDAYSDDEHKQHALAHSVYWAVIEQMLRTGEPAFTVDCGKDSGEELRNAPLSASTWVLTSDGYRQIGSLVGKEAVLWTGKQWAPNCVFHKTKAGVETVVVKATGGRKIIADPEHEFFVERYQGQGKKYRKLAGLVKVPAGELEPGDILHTSLPQTSYPEMQWQYTRGFIFGDGSVNGNRSEVTLCCDEKKALLPYLSDGYVSSITENDSRGYTRVYYKNAGHSKEYPQLSTPHIASWLAGLFDADGSYDDKHNYVRLSQPLGILVKVRRDLERIGIRSSIARDGKSGYTGKQCYLLNILASDIKLFALRVPTKRLKIQGFRPYRESHIRVVSVSEGPVEDVFCCDVHVDEHSFTAEGVIVSNCCEVTSRDTDDICNLGSLNLARIDDLEELKHLVDIGTSFLLAGSVYTDVPYTDVDKVLSKNRRLGLGLMGIHEWLLKRGKRYGPDEELGMWLRAYEKSGKRANKWADEWGLKRPKKTRAIAPTGTVSIVAETTGGIEPVFCSAYKRRYLKGDRHFAQYVIDPCAKRLIQQGIDPDAIEDAYTLAENVERRVAFQAWVQQFVDHAISSTINLPAWGSEFNNQDTVREFGSMLIRYLPQLRGITTYPDGSRGGQPLTPVPYKEAAEQEGIEIVEEQQNVCSLRGGSCGD